jgi:Fe-S-cluster containining protein
MNLNGEAREAIRKRLECDFEILSIDDKFKFGCSICGECCRNRDDIIVSPYDIYRLSKALNITSQEVVKKYCDSFLGEDSKIPLLNIKFKNCGISGAEYAVCPFLRKKDNYYRCTVHQNKPGVCALFPLGKITRRENGEIQLGYIKQPSCKNAKDEQEYTVKEWLDSYNLNEFEQISIDYAEFLHQLTHKMNFKSFCTSSKISDVAKDAFYNTFLFMLYSELDNAENITKFLKERYVFVLNKVDDIIFMAKKSNINLKG